MQLTFQRSQWEEPMVATAVAVVHQVHVFRVWVIVVGRQVRVIRTWARLVQYHSFLLGHLKLLHFEVNTVRV